MKNIDEYQLTKNVTVGELKVWINLKDDESKQKIIDLIYHRFQNRYIKHVKKINSGFLKMAISCLMIETLESFKLGKNDTNGKGNKIFKSFFESEEDNFPGFKELHYDFYSNIRCGILHQAETKNAWRILLKDELLNSDEKAINARLFVESLEKSFEKYIANLQSKDWEDKLWQHAIKKLKNICDNCNIKD